MRVEKFVLSEERKASLTAYIQETSAEFSFGKRPAMVVIPGGGYAMCSDREAEPVALAYMNAGYNAFVLRYTTTDVGKWPYPLQDYEAAMELLEAKADEFGIDASRIACVGFSAGGHLAACAATVAKHKPRAAVLVYPAILEEICNLCQPGMPYPCQEVKGDTAPCFIIAARDDAVVPVKNAIAFADSLADQGIQFEMHIYSLGQHGFSTAAANLNISEVCSRLPEWVDYSIKWLNEVMGELTASGFTKPKLLPSINGDAFPMLSVHCTVRHIRACRNADEAMAEFYGVVAASAREKGLPEEGVYTAIGPQTIKSVMEMLVLPVEQIEALDGKLKLLANSF
ncbi:MAG: alpha/beta hydrolase [Blautia sp.]|nr:alpha/beta hydrolase [Blautia sp.]